MHPAKSVIFFTTASGAGYGMMVWLAVLGTLGLVPAQPPLGIAAFGIGFALIVGGLLSSTFHLGHPERAWRALSQWRSSWLSREGVMAILTFVPLGLFALAWVGLGENGGFYALIGLAGAAMSLLTIFTTSMIYASLRPIPAWHNGWTVAGYLVLGPMNGLLIVAVLLAAFGQRAALDAACAFAIVLIPIALLVKLLYWHHIHRSAATSTAASATGLGHLGTVELTASPHDSDNYLLREMGFRIARKHADKLRVIAAIAAFGLPWMLIAASLWLALTGTGLTMLMLAAAVSCQIGITIERWLFFAEAKHAVTLYYGAQAV